MLDRTHARMKKNNINKIRDATQMSLTLDHLRKAPAAFNIYYEARGLRLALRASIFWYWYISFCYHDITTHTLSNQFEQQLPNRARKNRI